MTVQELRNMGYKVRVLHNRLYNGYYKWQVGNKPVQCCGSIHPDPRGGSTQIVIDAPNGDHFDGLAVCSKEDNYNKRLGVRIALGRSGVLEYVAK